MNPNEPPESEKQLTDANEYAHLPCRKDQFGKYVPEKPANKPHSAYQDWKAKQEAMEKARGERKKARGEKLARGEDLGPDPDAPKATTLKNGLCWLLRHRRVSMELPYQVDDVETLVLPANDQIVYTESQLARFDGTDPSKPILLALDGIVYDVTPGRRTYGPGGSYSHFSGKDAA